MRREPNQTFRSVFKYVNRAIGAFGTIVLPLLIQQHLLVCPWCNQSYVLYRVSVFQDLSIDGNVAINDLCFIELVCGLSLLFRLCYLGFAYNTIVDTHIARMREHGRDPKGEFSKSIIIGAVLSLVLVLAFEAFMSPSYLLHAHGVIK